LLLASAPEPERLVTDPDYRSGSSFTSVAFKMPIKIEKCTVLFIVYGTVPVLIVGILISVFKDISNLEAILP
jgi:hypothetical protein